MTNNSSNNYVNTSPEAKQNLDKMKYEIANQIGVNLKQGYNGDLTSRQAGSVGGPDGQKDDQVLRRKHEVKDI